MYNTGETVGVYIIFPVAIFVVGCIDRYVIRTTPRAIGAWVVGLVIPVALGAGLPSTTNEQIFFAVATLTVGVFGSLIYSFQTKNTPVRVNQIVAQNDVPLATRRQYVLHPPPRMNTSYSLFSLSSLDAKRKRN